MRRVQRVLTGIGVAGATGAFLLGGALTASAHVTPDPPTAPKGAGDQVFTFRVPNELPTANTVKFTLQLPQDHPIASVDVLAMPGWTSTVQTRHLATPITTDDGSFSEVASVITWTGGKIGPGQYGDFEILAQGLPTDTDQLVFKALQGYDNGETVAWIETQPNAEHPAPTVELTAEVPQSGAAATTVPASSSSKVTAVKVTKSSDSSKGLAIAGLVVGGIGLIVAIVAVVLARKRPAGADT